MKPDQAKKYVIKVPLAAGSTEEWHTLCEASNHEALASIVQCLAKPGVNGPLRIMIEVYYVDTPQ